MSSIAEQDLADRRARAIQQLLHTPLLHRDTPSFDTIATSEQWLKEWFLRTCGWILIVDYRRGMARLRKVTGWIDSTHPQRSLRTGKSTFTIRKYVTFCLTAAALGEHGRSRISLQDIAVAVSDLSVRAKVSPFTDLDHKDRQALVDVLMLLSALRVVTELDRTGRDYSVDSTGNVLYEIDERRLGQLLVASLPPARCSTWQQMAVDPHPQPGSGAPLGAHRLRQHLMRRLLDQPVCYLSDLPDDDAAAVGDHTERITQWLSEAGLALEIRADAWMVVNRRAGSARSLRDGSNVSNCALLVLPQLTAQPSGWISATHLATLVDELLDEYPWWARSLRNDRNRADAVAAVLRSFDLIRPQSDGWRIMPAAWRWAARVDPACLPPSSSPIPTQPAQDDLFSVEPTHQ